jgi:hypothetical protein
LAIAAHSAAPAVSAKSEAALRIPATADPADSEKRIKDWLSHRPALSQPAAWTVEPDLKDALAPKRLEGMDPSDKRALIERLPGMAQEVFLSCRTLESCPKAPSSFFVRREELVGNAAAALIRPWMLLQKARGRELSLSAGTKGELARFSVAGLPKTRLGIVSQPAPGGGYVVRLRGPKDPSAVYESERFSALASLRP